MLLPATQNLLFRDILDGFEVKTEIADAVLAEIYSFIFNPLKDPPVMQDAGLQQAVLVLRNIAEMEQLSSLEGIALFFDTEDREIDSWTQQIIDETVEAQAVADKEIEYDVDEEYEHGPVVQAIAKRPALSRYYVSFDESYHHAFVEVYKQLYPDLHEFFSRFIGKSDLGNLVAPEDLIQETVLLVWNSGKRESADLRMVRKNLCIAAEKIWYKCIAQHDIRQTTSMANVPDHRGESSLEIMDFEFRDLVAYLRTVNCPLWPLELRMAGYMPQEIASYSGLDIYTVLKLIAIGTKCMSVTLTNKTNGKFFKGKKAGGSNWKFYRDSGGKWRWRRYTNGRWVQSTSGFDSRADCVRAVRKLGYNGG